MLDTDPEPETTDAQGTAKIREGLLVLTVESGRLSALATRIIMYLFKPGDTLDPDCKTSFENFRRVISAMHEGNTGLGVDPAAAKFLRDRKIIDNDNFQALTMFVDMARTAVSANPRLPPDDPQIEMLSEFLNELLGPAIDALQEQVRAGMQANRKTSVARRSEAQTVVMDASVQLSKVARSTRMLSINAMIEAQRLGSEGLGIGHLAHEMVALTDQVSEITSRISNQMHRWSE